MTWLVTGVSGYIGTHLASDLTEKGIDFVGVDLFAKDLELGEQKYIVGDVLDLAFLEDLFERNEFEGVIHLSSLKDATLSNTQINRYWKFNVTSTDLLVQLSIKYGVSNFVLASSAAVYGESTVASYPLQESQKVQPDNFYGFTKLASEEILKNSKSLGISSISLRFFNVVGVNNTIFLGRLKGGFPVTCAEKILEGEDFEIFKAKDLTLDGTCLRDYVDVQDVSLSIVKSIFFLRNSKDSICEVLNIGSGCEKSTLQIVRELESLLGLRGQFKIMSSREESSRSVADIRMAESLIDWSPSVDFSESLNSVLLNLKSFENSEQQS